VTTLTADSKHAADHDNDSGCGDDSASSYGSNSSNNGTASELGDATTAVGASNRSTPPTENNGKY